MEHKLAAYRYMIHRMSSISRSQEKLNTEWQTIRDIPNSNNFPEPLITKLRTTLQNPNKTHDDNNKQRKWATFTYHSPKIRKVTNLFKHTNTNIAFRSSNTIAQLTRTVNYKPPHDFEKSGIYQISCKTCHKSYAGQTNRNLKTRFREHIRYIKNNDPQSAYAAHILENRHEFGNIEDTLTLHHPVNIATLLLPYEQLYIQSHHQKGILVPEQHNPDPNPILQLAFDPT
jgi:hypothetical protein